MIRTTLSEELGEIAKRIESSFEELSLSEADSVDTPPDTFYHYTSGDGLVGILKEKELWATNILYLNDSTELSDARDVFSAELKTSLDLGQLSNWISTGLALYARILPFDHFVVSFCEHGDLLSQWRGYGPRSSGYSLGFWSSALSAAARTEKNNYRGVCSLRKVKYKNTEKAKMIGKRINILREALAPVANLLLGMTDPERGQHDVFLWQIASSLNPTFALMKNAAFDAEEEWRLVRTFRRHVVPTEEESPVLVRPVKGRLAPYLKLPWPVPNNGNSNELRGLNIVYCGPSAEPLLDQRAIGDLLLSCNSFRTRVLQSKVPLRA